jgi:NhaP-type Na+/H+ or K+/H+ antiporter
VLLIGQIVKHICNIYKLPYTPFLALFGFCVGSSSLIHKSVVASWVSVEPHFIMLLFLPPIIFEEAMNFDWYSFKK